MALLVLVLRAGLGDRSRLDGGNHETAGDILKEEDSEGWRGDRFGFKRCDPEGHRNELGASLADSLSGVVVEGIAGDSKTFPAILRLGVRLRDIKWVGEVSEGWRVELDAAYLESILVLADGKVKDQRVLHILSPLQRAFP